MAHRQSVRLGRTMKLPCPVEGDPPPLIMWTKDNRNIHSGWTRFRVLQHALRIKEVETEDAGTYICKATNGFGSVNVNYTLIIIGEYGQRRRVPPQFALVCCHTVSFSSRIILQSSFIFCRFHRLCCVSC